MTSPLPLPDLLFHRPRLTVDRAAVEEILGMAALGRSLGTELFDELAAAKMPGDTWSPSFFADDLFLGRLVADVLTLEIAGRSFPVNRPFLTNALGHVPIDRPTIEMRQEILRELDANDDLVEKLELLYIALFDLVSLHRTPSYQTSVDVAAFHLDILRQMRHVVDSMEQNFGVAHSALNRLHQSAVAIHQTDEWKTLAALLEYENGLARLDLEVSVGGDGRIRNFGVKALAENENNRFYRPPMARLADRARLLVRGYPMSSRELMERLINDVYRRLAPHFIPLIQLSGHLEFFLTARSFRAKALSQGLAMTLPEMTDPLADASAEGVDEGLQLEGLFNPLLLANGGQPVASRLGLDHRHPITIITGPNSGGKTRLLQAIGLAQMLGQSGVFAPISSGRLRILDGLFVSLVEDESAEQIEGRLGRELVRVRSLFEEMSPSSMVILDELCSGTNPSEGIEVFEMVLRLLREIEPTAFVTTHFLDFARQLAEGRLEAELEFRQVEIDEQQRSTYQFIEGVADTSLASVTAQRLGVTFDRLAEIIHTRRRAREMATAPVEQTQIDPSLSRPTGNDPRAN